MLRARVAYGLVLSDLIGLFAWQIGNLGAHEWEVPGLDG
jgi:hypothetical protein